METLIKEIKASQLTSEQLTKGIMFDDIKDVYIFEYQQKREIRLAENWLLTKWGGFRTEIINDNFVVLTARKIKQYA